MDVDFARLLPEHDVRHVSLQGWSGITNGELLKLAQLHEIEAFITADKNMPYQRNMKIRPFALIVLDVHPKNFANFAVCVPTLRELLCDAKPGSVYVINAAGLK